MKLKIGLVQINNSFDMTDIYLPYSVGLLQANAEKQFPNEFEFLTPVFNKTSLNEIIKHLLQADIVFFSLYIWNKNSQLKIAKELKKIKPEIKLVFGGPQVSSRYLKNFLIDNNFIDIACIGEIEIVGTEILKNKANKISSAGVNFINDGIFIPSMEPARIKDLDQYPSPYLEGTFEKLIKTNPSINWIPLWETNRGCPFNCAYCNWGSGTRKKINTFSLDRLYAEIDWFSKNKITFVWCCDANYGTLERDLEITKYIIKQKEKYGYPEKLSIQSTDNFKEHTYEIHKLLNSSKLGKTTNVALQTLNKNSLEAINRRNIPMEEYREIQTRLSENDIKVTTDLILGLPCETYDTFVDGIIELLNFYPIDKYIISELIILPNTEMENPEYQKKYNLETTATRVINKHGDIPKKDELLEEYEMVISTSTMPKEDWIKAETFAMLASVIFFDKLLQIPFIILNKYFNISYKKLFESFLSKDLPLIFKDIRNSLIKKASDIQNGDFMCSPSREWLNVMWPVDEFVFIKICKEYGLDNFYEQAFEILYKLMDDSILLKEMLNFNKNLIKMPFTENDKTIKTKYNLLETYNSLLTGKQVDLKQGTYNYLIKSSLETWDNWEEWFKEMVWYHYRKGDYLYRCEND